MSEGRRPDRRRGGRLRRLPQPARAHATPGVVRRPQSAPAHAPHQSSAQRPQGPRCRERRGRRHRAGFRDGAQAAAPGRASSGASRQRVLRVALRRVRGVRDRRLRRLRQHVVGGGPREPPGAGRPRVLPALARARVPGRDAAPRILEVRRRVQGDGAGALWSSGLRRCVAPRRPSRLRWELHARPRVLPSPVRGREHDVGRRRARHRPGVHAEARGAARTGPGSRRAVDGASRGHRGLAPGSLRGDRAARSQRASSAHTVTPPLSGRRLCDEQRAERQDPRAHPVPRGLRPAGGGRQRHGAGRGALRLASHARPAAKLRHGPRLLGPGVRRHRGRARAVGAASTARRRALRRREALRRRRAVPLDGGPYRRRPDRRMVPGAHGVGPTGPRQPQHPGRPATRRHA